MAQANPPSRIILEGGVDGNRLVGFPEGVDSFSSNLLVRPTQFRWLINASTSGGIAQTRPGYSQRLEFDMTEGTQFYDWWIDAGQPLIHPQMCVYFRPSLSAPQLVFAVSGSIWFCTFNPDGTLQTPQIVTTLQFSPASDQLTHATCVQTATIVSGLYANNQVPRNLLIIQDGVNRAGIWDGLTGIAANPQKKISVDPDGNTLYDAGWNETRIGMWMAWSGNRLWVSNGQNVFASDLGDPTHFTEELTLNSAQLFTFPGVVTGMVDRGTSGTTRSQVVVFTRTTTWTLWSGIQARLPSATAPGWAGTNDFQAKIFSAVGCTAGKSVIVHRGLLYWQSEGGIVLFDGTSTVNSTQNLPPIDNEMMYSKRRVVPSASITCAGIRESYVFWSVPTGPLTYGRNYNYQTQVLDRQTTVVRSVGSDGPFSYGTTGWQGVWTGIRPVEWTNGDIFGQTRTYALSMDLDGVVRIWEAFQGSRADNGNPIPWQIETRSHPVGNSLFDRNNFLYFRLYLDQITGNLDIAGAWRGLKGLYHDLLDTRVTATPGSLFTPVPGFTGYSNNAIFQSYTSQSRDVISPNVRGPDTECQAAGVESPEYDVNDRAFSLWLKFEGRGALVAYRIAADAKEQATEGGVEEPETGFHITPEASCPEFIEGTVPNYVIPVSPSQAAFQPIQSKLPETDDYAVTPL